VLFELGQDGYVYRRQQTQANGSWGAWAAMTGTQVKKMVAINGWNGRVSLVVTDPGGAVWESLVSSGNSFSAWRSLGGTGIQDLALTAYPDGQLSLFALGGDGHVYHQRHVPGTINLPAWSGWSSLGGSGVRGITAATYADGGATLFEIGGDKIVHEIRQQGPSGPFSWLPDLGGADLTQTAVGKSGDGHLEFFALTVGGKVYRTWQPCSNTGWQKLPAMPNVPWFTVDYFSEPPPYVAGKQLIVHWGHDLPAGCTFYQNLRVSGADNQLFYPDPATVVGWDYTPLVQGTYTFTYTAGCAEGLDGFSRHEVARSVTLNVVAAPAPHPPLLPPPMPPQKVEGEWHFGLGQVTPADNGPLVYWGTFGTGISGFELLTLRNPPSSFINMSLVKSRNDNDACWTASAVNLGPGQWTTPSDIQKLYGTEQPTGAIEVWACHSVYPPVASFQMDVKYLHY
jgi:hypothetical protein